VKSFVVLPALEATQLMRSGFLSAEDKRALADIATPPKPMRAGVGLVSEGARTDHFYFLIRGWACRHKETRDGARQITGLVMAGELCNLDSLMLDEVNYGVRTLTPTTVVALPRDRLRALCAERPGILRAFLWFLIGENAVLTEWTLSIGRQTARQRVARLLCEIIKRLAIEHENKASFELPITQEQIADILGLTPVHVNRTMQQLRTENLISTNNRRVSVPDMMELCRIGGFDAKYLRASPASATDNKYNNRSLEEISNRDQMVV
jgi:CRP-like cAMP-binding protein